MKHFLSSIFTLLILSGCAAKNVPPSPPAVSSAGTVPVIVDSYVTPNILSNMILPVYIEAQDQDGNMAGLWFVVSQVGVNTESTHYISLKPEYNRAFRGFVTIDIPKMDTNERLRIEITVVDQNGLKSAPVVKETIIGFGFPKQPPEKWKSFDTRRIGHIFFDFMRDREMDRF